MLERFNIDAVTHAEALHADLKMCYVDSVMQGVKDDSFSEMDGQ